jgi:hypothetical protein
MKSTILLIVFLAFVSIAQGQESESTISTSRSGRQKVSTKSFYEPEKVNVPLVTFLLGDGERINVSSTELEITACIKTDKPLTSLSLYVNDVLQPASRDLKVQADQARANCDQPFVQMIQLKDGENQIRLVAQNAGGTTTQTLIARYQRNELAIGEKRLALVIGNSSYPNASRLENPVNDAKDMAATLTELGFEVMLFTDLDKRKLRKAIEDFGFRLKGFQVGLFFYAGHGIAINGYNYLVPIDAAPQSASDIEFDCEPADRVVSKMEEAHTTNIIVLDACRNNPFERSFAGRSGDDGGLTQMKAPAGTIISYATAPGKTAADGTGRNGLYTAALLKTLKVPNMPVEKAFKQVRSEVMRISNGRQQPWESSSLIDDIYFLKK